MKYLIAQLDRVLASLLSLLLTLLVLAIIWQVLSRYVLNDPSSVTEEFARFAMIWIALLGASYAFRLRLHLGLNLFTASLEGRPKIYVELVSLCAVALFAICIMVIGGGRLVFLTGELNQLTAVMGLPMAYVYSVIPLSGIFILVYVIDFASDLITKGALHEPPTEESVKDYE